MRQGIYPCVLLGSLWFVATGLAQSPPRVAFSDRFIEGVKPQWAAAQPRVSVSPVGERRFLGPFGPEAVELKLNELAEHRFLRLTLDVLVIRSWDGNVGGSGPDTFTILTDDGRVVHCTSFGWVNPQAFPGFFGVHTAPPASGALAGGALGFVHDGQLRSAVYRIECTIPHRGATLGLRFIAGTNSGISDEAWGITSATVTLDGVATPSAEGLADAWQLLGADDPKFAADAVWILAAGGEGTVNLLRQRLRGVTLPANLELLDPSRAAIRVGPESQPRDPYAIHDRDQRRAVLGAHVLQLIASEAARAVLTEIRAKDDPSARLVTVTVKQKGTDRPIPNMPIWGVAMNEDLNATMITDAQGRVTVAVPPNTGSNVYVQSAQAGYVPMQMTFRGQAEATPLPAQVELQLDRGTTIGGTVVDDTGQPVEGATVVVSARVPGATAQLRPLVSYIMTSADREGRWSFDLMPPAYDSITLGVFHPRYLMSGGDYYSLEEFKEPVAVLRESKAVLKLFKGLPVEGVVYDPEGKPLRGARVGLGSDRVPSNILPDQRTDDQGRFFLAGKTDQPMKLTFQADGYAPQMMDVRVANEPVTLRIDMKPGNVLKGRVVDPQGKGIPGATVYMDTWRESRTLAFRLTADAEGNFVWNSAPDDDIKADVFRLGYADNRGIQIAAGRENVVTLKSPTKVSGTVVDDETGQSVPAFSIVTGIDFAQGRPIYWSRRSGLASPDGKDGKFELTFTFPYPGMAIRIEAEGYLPADTPTFPLDGESKSYEIRLKKGQNITGSVVDATGAPMAGADVILMMAGQQLSVSNGRLRPGEAREKPSAKSAADGTFTLSPQTEPFVVVVFHDKGYGRVSFDDFSKSPKVTLQAWAKIEGVFKIDGKVAPNINVSGSYSGEMQNFADRSAPRIMNQLYGKTDEQGRFTFDRVIPETVDLGHEVPMGNGMSRRTTAETVVAKPGETHQVTVNAPKPEIE